MITRKIGKLLRGGASPFQIYAATLLGASIGFAPGFAQAPGWMALLVILLILLNANLFVAGLAIVLGKIAYLLLLPVLFDFGVFLLEGPARGVFAALAGLPVLAWFGFEYYVVAAGIPVGLFAGWISGCFLVRAVRGFRKKMAAMESGSEAYAVWSSKVWVRALGWLVFGGIKGKQSWSELTAAAKTRPIRPIGAVLAVLVAVLLFVGSMFFQEQILTALTRSSLERLNGATVDIGSVKLAPADGKLRIENLAMADREDLGRNIFSASAIEADLAGLDLLRKRFALDRVEVSGGSSGEPRKIRGQPVGPAPEPAEPEPAPGSWGIAEVLKNAEMWSRRAQQFAELLEKVSPSQPDTTGEEPGEAGARSWRETLEERARSLGYANIATSSLAVAAPDFLVREFIARPVILANMEGEQIDVTGRNLSTQPWLADAPPQLDLQARSGTFGLAVTGPEAEATGPGTLRLHYRGLEVDSLAAAMDEPETLPFKGGTLDFEGDGSWSSSWIDLPLKVTARNTTVEAFGKSAKVSSLNLPARVVGSLQQPRLAVDSADFQKALQGAAGSVFRDLATDKLLEAAGGEKDGSLGSKIGGLLNFGKKTEEAPAEPPAEKEDP